MNSWQKKSIINPSVQKTSIGNRIQNQNYGQKKALNIFYTMTKIGRSGHLKNNRTDELIITNTNQNI